MLLLQRRTERRFSWACFQHSNITCLWM